MIGSMTNSCETYVLACVTEAERQLELAFIGTTSILFQELAALLSPGAW